MTRSSSRLLRIATCTGIFARRLRLRARRTRRLDTRGPSPVLAGLAATFPLVDLAVGTKPF